jgi:hypothetical protein
MFISDYSKNMDKFICTVNSKIKVNHSHQIEWESRGSQQYVSAERYGRRYAKRLAKIIAKALTLEFGYDHQDSDIGTVDSKTGGTRVIIWNKFNFSEALELYQKNVVASFDQEKVAILLEKMKKHTTIKENLTIPKEVKEAEALLNELCNEGTWHDNDYFVGQTLNARFKCLNPCSTIEIQPIEEGKYLIKAYSYYTGENTRRGFAKIDDIEFILFSIKTTKKKHKGVQKPNNLSGDANESLEKFNSNLQKSQN